MNDIGYSIGPGLNAAAMDSQGWLDNSRVRKIASGVESVDLRPLHRRDLHGPLAITIDNYYVEFRMNEGWDAAFPSPVLYWFTILKNGRWWATHILWAVGIGKLRKALGPGVLTNKGDKFEIKFGEHTAFYYHLKIELENIDVTQRIARISIDYSPSSFPPEPVYTLPEGWKFQTRPGGIPLTHLGLAQDTLIVNEKIIRTPQWSLRPILKSLADISSSDRFNNQNIRRTIRQEALETIIKIANEALNEMNFPKGLAPPPDLREQSSNPHEDSGG